MHFKNIIFLKNLIQLEIFKDGVIDSSIEKYKQSLNATLDGIEQKKKSF